MNLSLLKLVSNVTVLHIHICSAASCVYIVLHGNIDLLPHTGEMADLVVLHSSDSKEWSEYLQKRMSDKNLNLRVTSYDHDKLLVRPEIAKESLKNAKAVILIVSPYLFDTLTANPQLSYVPHLDDPSKVVMFLLGIDVHQFTTSNTINQFPNLDLFAKFSHDGPQMTAMLERTIEMIDERDVTLVGEKPPLKHRQKKPKTSIKPSMKKTGSHDGVSDKKNVPPNEQRPPIEPRQKKQPTSDKLKKKPRSHDFVIQPISIQLPLYGEADCSVMVLFEEAQAEDQSFQVLLEDSNDSGYNFTLPLTTHNPYTFSFKAPAMPEGEYRVKLTALSGVKTSAAPTLKYESQAMDILEMSQFYMHCMREAFTIAINNGTKVSDLDEAMRKAFDTPSGIPVRAFELIFGFLDKSLIDTSIFDAPTLLHLAAEFGLNEFADRLLKLPSAAMVNNMSNGQSRYPCDIARVCKYTHGGHLADMLSAARELDEEFQNYISMVNYYNLNTEDAEDYEPIPTVSLIKNKTFPGYVPMQSRGVSMRPNHGSVRGREDRDPSLYNYVDRSALPDPFAELSDQAAAKPESRLPLDLGAQIELIEYMEGFKTGEYSLNDAVILFEEWKRRQMQSGGSLKQKREELNKLKNDIHSVTNGADINISRPNDPSIPLTPTTPTSPPLTAPKPQKKPSFFNRFLYTKKKPSTKQSSAANSPEADVSQQQPLAGVMEETPPAHRYSSSSNGSRTSNLSRSSNSSGFQDEVDEVPGKRQSFRMEAFRSLELSLPPPALPPRLSHRPRPPVRNESRDTRHR